MLPRANRHLLLGQTLPNENLQGEKAIVDWLMPVHEIFNSFEDLEIPKVVAINGMALGGGFEMCLVCDYRDVRSCTSGLTGN